MSTFGDFSLAGYLAYTLPIMPPNAVLSPASNIDPSQRGKIPGVYQRGMRHWSGMAKWVERTTSPEDIRRWDRWLKDGPVNIGLRTGELLALDIDITAPAIADAVERLALDVLGLAPIRGRADSSKRLLVYKLAPGETKPEKSRIAFTLEADPETTHAVEFLGHGQQFVAEGIHSSGAAYEWRDGMTLPRLGEDLLTRVTHEAWDNFQGRVALLLESIGAAIRHRSSSGSREGRQPIGDPSLVAADLTELGQAVRTIPCEKIASYDEWLTLMHAIKAAAGGDEAFFHDVVLPWCLAYPDNDPDVIRGKWDSIFTSTIGADYVYGVARSYGFIGGVDGLAEVPPDEVGGDGRSDNMPPEWAEAALKNRFVTAHLDKIRFMPATQDWKFWDGIQWKSGKEMDEISTLVQEFLEKESTRASRSSGNVIANRVASKSTLRAVVELSEYDRRVKIARATFDLSPWLLNTLSGVVDLRTGEVLDHESTLFCSKLAPVKVGTGIPVRFMRFLDDFCLGDIELKNYLLRALGYSLTGDTSEQVLFFIHGISGSGKSTLMRIVSAIMGDYQTSAAMSTFVANANDKHPTDLAKLVGARLVQAHETKEGHYFDEQVIKQVTGQDTVTARFMHKDYFDYRPEFKPWIIGNKKPHFRSPDDAIRRRMQIITACAKPTADPDLERGIIEHELPQVLSLLIEGCRMWQTFGLDPPNAVRAATDEYLASEDKIRAFLEERTIADKASSTTTADLYREYDQWCRGNGIRPKASLQFVQEVRDRGFNPALVGKKRLSGLRGLKLRTDFD